MYNFIHISLEMFELHLPNISCLCHYIGVNSSGFIPNPALSPEQCRITSIESGSARVTINPIELAKDKPLSI
jgi:hypothetical protein